MLIDRELWQRARPVLATAAVLIVVPIVAAPYAARLFAQDSAWQEMLQRPAGDPIWIDPDWREIPYIYLRLRDAQWQHERTVAPNTGDVITVSSTTYAGHEFWTITTTEGEQQ